MPLTSPASYVVSVPLFLNHWQDANALGPDIVLDREQCGQAVEVDRDFLVERYDELLDARNVVEGTLLDLTLAQAVLLQEKTWVQAHVVNFNQIMRAEHGASPYVAAVPDAPGVGDGQEKFSRPARLAAALWVKVNVWRAAMVPPRPALTLADGTTQAQYAARLVPLAAQYAAVEEREQQAGLDRGLRNEVQAVIYPIAKVYRLKIQSVYTAGSALLMTLPALTEDAGTTPAAGTLAGQYNAVTSMADLTGTPSPTPGARNEIRASLGTVPSVEDESMRASFAPGQAIALSTDFGLAAAGAMVHYRLVSITAGGHERATAWLTLQRPL